MGAYPHFGTFLVSPLTDRIGARGHPESWKTMRSRIEPMKKIAGSLRQHRELILNYFRAQKLFSSVVVEALNNKPKSP